MKRWLPVLVLLPLLLGCASSSDVGDVRRDVTTVYQEFRTYKNSTDARLARLEKEMATLSQSVRSVEDLTRKQFLDLSMSLEGKDDKIKSILGKLEELESQLQAYWGETKGALKEMRGGTAAPPGSPGLPRKTAMVPPKGNYEKQYKLAFDAFQRRLYQKSVRAFSDFVRSYPDTPLVPNAHYWMGEAHMNLKDQEKYIIQEVIDKYPKSEKAPRLAQAGRAFGDRRRKELHNPAQEGRGALSNGRSQSGRAATQKSRRSVIQPHSREDSHQLFPQPKRHLVAAILRSVPAGMILPIMRFWSLR
jgi:TolA-binding protein